MKTIAMIVGVALLAACSPAVQQKAGAASSTSDQLSSAVPDNVPSAETPGRYQIIHSPHIEKDTILLDTSTGQTWQLVEDAKLGLWWKPLLKPDH